MNDTRHEQIASGLADRGFVVVPGFLARDPVTALRGEGKRRRAAGEFHAASVGRAGTSDQLTARLIMPTPPPLAPADV